MVLGVEDQDEGAVAEAGGGELERLLDAPAAVAAPAALGPERVEAAVAGGEERRPRSFLAPQSPKSHGWIAASFAFLGGSPPAAGSPTPPTITPVVVSRALLRATLEAVEARAGPVEAFFARARAGTSEFMLIHALAALGGGWDTAYAPGLVPPATIARSTDAAGIDAALTRVERGEADLLGIHVARLARLDPATRARVETIWRDRGLDPGDLLPAP